MIIVYFSDCNAISSIYLPCLAFHAWAVCKTTVKYDPRVFISLRGKRSVSLSWISYQGFCSYHIAMLYVQSLYLMQGLCCVRFEIYIEILLEISCICFSFHFVSNSDLLHTSCNSTVSSNDCISTVLDLKNWLNRFVLKTIFHFIFSVIASFYISLK